MVSIGESAFDSCTALEIILPGSIVSVGESAFRCCRAITSVALPDGCSSVGEGAFALCTALTSVIIPDSVTYVGAVAFGSTPWVKTLTDEFVIVGDGVLMLYNGTSGTVAVPDGVKHICYALSDCDSVKNIILPAGVLTVCDGAFEYCDNLTSVSVPAGITYFGSDVFNGCIAAVITLKFAGTQQAWEALEVSLPSNAVAVYNS